VPAVPVNSEAQIIPPISSGAHFSVDQACVSFHLVERRATDRLDGHDSLATPQPRTVPPVALNSWKTISASGGFPHRGGPLYNGGMFRAAIPAIFIGLLNSLCPAGLAHSQVLIPVLVTTDKGVPVNGLAKENFHLFEDKTEQRIARLTVDHGPVSLGILVDTSGSMTASLAATAHGVASLLSDEVHGDESFLLEFAGAAQVTVPFTGDSEKVIQHVMQARPGGHTCLLDAIDLGLRELQHARNPRRAIVIFSDGGDNASHSSESAIHKSLSESDVVLFAIGIFHRYSGRSPTPGEIEGPHLLGKLAQQTGGELYSPERLDALVRLGHLVATELHTRYVLSYSPAHSLTDGKLHRIKIKLTPPPGLPKLDASYRQGYMARTQ